MSDVALRFHFVFSWKKLISQKKNMINECLQEQGKRWARLCSLISDPVKTWQRKPGKTYCYFVVFKYAVGEKQMHNTSA